MVFHASSDQIIARIEIKELYSALLMVKKRINNIFSIVCCSIVFAGIVVEYLN
jgi:hypothetical protein